MNGARTIALLLALVSVAAGCGGADEPGAPAAAESTPASPLVGTSFDGERVSLADFRGKPVFVNVWSSW